MTAEKTESTKEHLRDLLASFDTAFLITHHGEKEHGRPMAVAGIDGADTIWFVTSDSSPKAGEIKADTRVSATFQSTTRFVALSGVAQLVKDRSKIEELWKPSWKVWFPEGKDDPTLALIRVTVRDAEYWDNAGSKGIRYFIEAAKGLLRGEPPRVTKEQHARVIS